MTSGLANDAKAKVRQYAQGPRRSRGAARRRGGGLPRRGDLHLLRHRELQPDADGGDGAAAAGLVVRQPGTPLRDALTDFAVQRVLAMGGAEPITMARIVDEKAIVNGIVGLLATGGSTNHTMHLVAMARAPASASTGTILPSCPRWCRYWRASIRTARPTSTTSTPPAACRFWIRELLQAGLLHADVHTVLGCGLQRFAVEPWLDGGALAWRDAPERSADDSVLRRCPPVRRRRRPEAACAGNLGRAVVKTSAVALQHRRDARAGDRRRQPAGARRSVQAGARSARLRRRGAPPGAQANGMPELHKLTPILGVLQDQGRSVALVTDGRMSGASGNRCRLRST